MDTRSTFNILDHIEKLEQAKGKGRYVCPACQGNNFTIGKNGAYQCWSGCKNEDIREALAPRGERHQERRSSRVIPRQPKPPAPAPLPAQDKMVLARLPELPTDIPVKQHRLDRERGKIAEIIYRYDADREVNRIEWADSSKPKGYAKSVIPCHVDSEGQVKRGKGSQPWPLYREAEALLYGLGKWVVLPEGEPCVEVCRWLQLLGVTFQGSDWSESVIEKKLVELKTAGIAGILCLPDNDEPGTKKANKIAAAADIVGMPLVIIPPKALWSDMPHAGDIADWVKWGQEQGMEREDFVRKLEELFLAAAEQTEGQNQPEDNQDVKIPDNASGAADVIEVFCQTAFEAIYGYWPWICVNNVLHCWSQCQTYYKESPDVVERRRIAEFCNTYPVEHKTPGGAVYYKYSHATPEWVERVLKWVKIRLAIKPELADPPGLNCTNGVLELIWEGSTPSWLLVDHDPKIHFYTYEPQVKFDPSADPTHCERLLEVLDKPQQEIFLRTIAASLDLATVRQHKGRLVRAIFAKGHGNNGKDSLREIVARMYGNKGLTGATLNDFAQYDLGRKFPLSGLIHSRVNWASENASNVKLDEIQSLKAYITGDPLDSEQKGKDSQSYIPVGVPIFNINDCPRVQAVIEAIKSRYSVLLFNKTFKIGADPSKGEIEADPRFKYDPNFLQSEVLPAFLNRVLASLVNLMADGIDYSCTDGAMEDIQTQNSHLFQFCQDMRLQYDPTGKLTAGEIWLQLEQWYIDNGTLTYEETSTGKKKALWVDQARKGDANVRGANQVIARFQNLFPRTKRITITSGPEKNRMALLGIGFKAPDNPGNPDSPGNPTDNPDSPGNPTDNPTDNPPSNPDTPKNATEVSQLPYQASQLVSQLELPQVLLDKGLSESGKAGKPVSRSSEPTEINTNMNEPTENSDFIEADRANELPYLAYNPVIVSDTALQTALTTALPATQTGLPDALVEVLVVPVAVVTVGVGDCVADKSGRVSQVTGLAQGGFLTSTGDYVSRADIRSGVYTKVNPPTETVVLPSDEWDTPDNVEALTEWLNACESSEMLADVRKAYPQPQALKAACKGLDAFKVQQIAEWVVELNSQPENQ